MGESLCKGPRLTQDEGLRPVARVKPTLAQSRFQNPQTFSSKSSQTSRADLEQTGRRHTPTRTHTHPHTPTHTHAPTRTHTPPHTRTHEHPHTSPCGQAPGDPPAPGSLAFFLQLSKPGAFCCSFVGGRLRTWEGLDNSLNPKMPRGMEPKLLAPPVLREPFPQLLSCCMIGSSRDSCQCSLGFRV